MIHLSKFVKEHIPLCVCTLGIAIFGYIGYHTVRWIINKCQKIEKIDQVSQRSLSVSSENNFSQLNNDNSIFKVSDFTLSNEKDREEEIPLKQESEEQKNLAAVKIQSVYRGHVARLAIKKLQVEKLEVERCKAAIKIQSIWRGYLGRIKAEKTKKPLLSYALLEKAKPYVDTPSNLYDVPRAPSGKTPVYLPKELPIVLKQSGSPENKKRFEQMKQARVICEKSGYENLVIPKARVYGCFIVESRLPITIHGTKEQIGLYIENRDQFTDAVKEFTGFLCQSMFGDITGGSSMNPYITLSDTPVGRYDNLALYLEKEEGKIGLIDLEEFAPLEFKGQRNCIKNCRDAVHLFPYHLNEIINAAKEFDSNTETYRKKLEQERDETLKRFKIVYEDHLDFVREKGITLDNPIAFERLGLDRVEQLKKVIEMELYRENDDGRFEGCLGDKPGEALICFNEKAFPKILNAVYTLISDMLEFNLESSESPLSSNLQLLSVRTLHYQRFNILLDDFKETVEILNIKHRLEIKVFVYFLFDIILKELVKGKEIAYYNQNIGYIFC